jgi:hypothetical protein
MRGALKTAILVVAAMLALGAVAFAEEAPTRDEYVAQVDPICKKNADANQKILKGVQDKARAGKLKAAGGQFIRAAAAFGAARQKIVVVPLPTEYAAKLQKWFVSLKKIQTTLTEIGKTLKEGNKIRAAHLSIQLEHSTNSANNISFPLEFRYCHLRRSQFF